MPGHCAAVGGCLPQNTALVSRAMPAALQVDMGTCVSLPQDTALVASIAGCILIIGHLLSLTHVLDNVGIIPAKVYSANYDLF